MEVRFHCTQTARRAARKSKHQIDRQCGVLKKVLRLNPEWGPVIPGHAPLRKMRVAVPDSGIGKSGGYRAIYRVAMIDEIKYLVFLSVYFKGDREDLAASEYSALAVEAEAILSDVLSVAWED